jgi:predicted nucleic acid-binding protein
MSRKFSKYVGVADSFLAAALISSEIISTPTDEETAETETAIRDVKDRPILRVAIKAWVDFILTGDKDFLESGLKKPQMFAAADFIVSTK